MSYSNNRIYTETVGGQPVGVSIHDVQRALSDGSPCLRTLCQSERINVWARYRPIPCAKGVNNIATPINDSQRQDERYGIDLPIDTYAAGTIEQYENYVNDTRNHNGYYVKLRPWGDSHWKRLTDFVKTDVNGRAVNGKGYDHKAKMDDVVVKLTGTHSGTYYLCPLIDEGSRTMYIQDGTTKRFQFPFDSIWMNEYFKYIAVPQQTSDVTEIRRNEEWLSPLDLMGASQYTGKNYAVVKRRIVIFKKEIVQGVEKWVFKNYVTDTSGCDASLNGAYLDLTRNGYDNNAYNPTIKYPDDPVRQADYESRYSATFLGNLEGVYLFLDCWVDVIDSQNVMPIPNYIYEVDIRREAAPPVEPQHVYITSVFVFALPPTPSVTVANDSIVFTCVIYPSAFLRSGDVLYDSTYYADRNAELISTRLRDFFDSISLRVGTMTFNLFININEAYVVRRVDDWIELDLQVYADEQGQLDPTGWTAEINAMVKQQFEDSIQGHDDLTITT